MAEQAASVASVDVAGSNGSAGGNKFGGVVSRGTPPAGTSGAEGAPKNKKPNPAFARAMSAVTGAPTSTKKPAAAKPKNDPVPSDDTSPEDSPELESDEESAAQKRANAAQSRIGGKQKLEALRNKDNARPAPAEPKSQEDDDGQTQEDQSVNEENESAAPARTAQRTGDDRADGDEHSAVERTAFNSFARRFGLNPGLDSTVQARDHVLDQAAQIVSGQADGNPPGGQPAGPAAGQGQQGGQPPQASGPLTPARNPASGQPFVLDDSMLSAAIDEYGPTFEPIAKAIQGMQQQLQDAQQWRERQTQISQARDQQAAQKLVHDFFGDKARAGFRDQLGTQAKGITPAQLKVRNEIVQNAIKIAGPMKLSDTEALELAFQLTFREQQAATARQQGRQEVHDSVKNRHRMTSLPGGAGSRSNATSSAFSGALSSFVQRRK